MLAKFGFILLVLLFGILMFAGGAVAPDTLRGPVTDLITKISPPKTKAAQTPAPAHAAAPAAAALEKEPSPIPYEALLLPVPLPAEGTYALQLGLYADAASVEDWGKRAQKAKYPLQAIAVVDQNGTRWWAVAVGSYPSPEDARAARASVSRQLELAQPLTVIRLPAPPPKAAATRSGP